MKKARAPRDGQGAGRRRKPRRRRLSWLSNPELDALARARCLMLLSVLSGEKSVSEAIREEKISRPSYYQLETRALNAMLAALNPLGASAQEGPDRSVAAARIEELHRQLQRLQQDKRRAQRLLLLSRKSLRLPRPRRGRPPKNPQSSTLSGRPRSKRSKAKAPASAPSIPMKAGEAAS